MKKTLFGLILTIIYNLAYAGTGPIVTGNITHSTIPMNYYFLEIYVQDSPTPSPDFLMNIFFMPELGYINGGQPHPITITKLVIENKNPSCQDKNHIFTLPLPASCGVTITDGSNININGALKIQETAPQLECPNLSVDNLFCTVNS